MTPTANLPKWIDGHLDLAYLAELGRDLTIPQDDPETGCISLPALRDANVDLVFATIFTERDEVAGVDPNQPWAYPPGEDDAARNRAERAGLRQLEIYQRLEQEGEVSIVRSADDLTIKPGDILPKILILMEGADPIRKPEDVARWHDAGIRMVGLTWAMGSRFAGGNATHDGLTDGGRELIASLDEQGIIHDASHLADDAFDELLEIANGPIVASHSNSRAVVGTKNQRHLRDDHIKAIAERDGIIGHNLYVHFLTAEKYVAGADIGRRATIDDCVAHLNHVADVAGSRSIVALGSDADGGFPPTYLPAALDHPRTYDALADALRGDGWSDDDIVGFQSGNWMRFLRRTMPSL